MSKQSPLWDKPFVQYFLFILISIIYFYIICHFFNIDYAKLKALDPNSLGDFLAGTFAPLGFILLILGYLQNTRALKMQGDELKISNESFRKQCEELKNSVEQQKALALTTEQELEHLKKQSEIELDIMLTNAQPFFHFTLSDAVKHDVNQGSETLISPNDKFYKNFEYLLFEIGFTNSRTIARELELKIECDFEVRRTERYSIIDEELKAIMFTIKNKIDEPNYLADCKISLTFSYFDNLDLLQEQKFTLILKQKDEPHLVAVNIRREPRNFLRILK
ncbi:hypothetical protein [Acinetobacter gerneri]|uniref:Uncharacterized protein n=1 Tax=Acinetobacter gerneri DSM 14967 = CIP 107464 = MTCC 9824 TaxID=1120926 RepID=N8YBA0_9GAMM|nr:hypothetical protein [Acinetobacter gerneri]ENV33931.1 hypothetical protein F960_01937 [Acinetobacter gerneri DSM 14967 = CIP 107464 = MTCC 9824]EPR82808.1 hypothetical protein L289_2726 [Acinetobacter gerneri DSM 14967 = CIP 107464 = MTCC 9824]MDV2438694.1 hypothetical protein [Acinetobacter gerneri]